MSDFGLKVLKRVRFCEKIVCFKVSPKSTTYTVQNGFLHKTMYSYNLQHLRQLDISIRHRSSNTSCTSFRKDFEILFRCIVPLFSLDKPNTCRN